MTQTDKNHKKWRIWSLPPPARLYVSVVNVAAALGLIAGIWLDPPLDDLVEVGWLLLVAGIGVESSQWIERLRERHRENSYKDLYSAWTLAAALLFSPGTAILFTTVFSIIVLLRPGRYRAYRSVFSSSILMLATIGASLAYSQVAGTAGLVEEPITFLAVVIATCVYLALSLGLTWCAIRLSAQRHRRTYLAGIADIGIDTVACCLGILIAAAYAVSLWLVIFALPTLLLLQRGLLLAQFQSAARTDDKTGLANASWWHEIAGRELERASRLGEPVAVLITDLDYFKQVNDSYGHVAGDFVLRTVAKLMVAEVREYDLVGRFGGEEFIVLLPATNHERALTIAERLRRRISSLHLDITDAQQEKHTLDRLTISVGVATFPDTARDLNELIRSADAALYIAKSRGRNQVSDDRNPDGDSAALRRIM